MKVRRCCGCRKALAPKWRGRCTACKRVQDNAYRARNKEKIKTQRAKAYAERRHEILAERRRYRAENQDKVREQEKRAYQKNRFRRRVQAVCRKYKITYDQYLQMYAAQAGACDICGVKHRTRKLLCVDHDHATGRVRALLCDACNAGIGMFKESPELLRAALKYLARQSKIRV